MGELMKRSSDAAVHEYCVLLLHWLALLPEIKTALGVTVGSGSSCFAYFLLGFLWLSAGAPVFPLKTGNIQDEGKRNCVSEWVECMSRDGLMPWPGLILLMRTHMAAWWADKEKDDLTEFFYCDEGTGSKRKPSLTMKKRSARPSCIAQNH